MDDATQSLCRKYRGKVAECLVAMQDKEDDAVDILKSKSRTNLSSHSESTFISFDRSCILIILGFFNQALILYIARKKNSFPVQ